MHGDAVEDAGVTVILMVLMLVIMSVVMCYWW